MFLRTIGILTSDSCLSQVCCGLEEEYGSLPMVDAPLFCFKTIPLVLTHPLEQPVPARASSPAVMGKESASPSGGVFDDRRLCHVGWKGRLP